MKISVIGTGYVGLVQGTVLAHFGFDVTCIDIDEKKIESLQSGILPIYEPGLLELVEQNALQGRLHFTTGLDVLADADVIFIAVGTPPKDDGSADMSFVEQAAHNIGQYITGYTVVVDKSTVPIGTARQVGQIIAQGIVQRGLNISYDVVSNPEFLREGRAVHDCLIPDRIIIGADSERAMHVMKSVYDTLFINQTPFLFTNIETAEMIKYASNAFLSVKISFINEMALLADKVGADIQEVARGMGMDGRISPKFLHAGPGYGGSCFPKDTRAIADTARNEGEELMVVEAAIRANEKQKRILAEFIASEIKKSRSLHEASVAIWGLSFKPETDDIRESPAIDLIRHLVRSGISIRVYCPQGMREAKRYFKDIEDRIVYCEDEYVATCGTDALVLVTEWYVFRNPDLKRIRTSMRGDCLFDLRNALTKHREVASLFRYYGTGSRDSTIKRAQ